MPCPNYGILGNYLTFAIQVKDGTGAPVDADALPTYKIYEDETGVEIVSGTMAKLDDVNTTGFYSERIAISVGNGYEGYKTYTIRVVSAVGGIAIAKTFSFVCSSSGSASLPVPTIDLATIKTILQIADTEYDAVLTILIPIIESIVITYCGVSAISDLAIGVIFPIAGLCKYAMENPIGAVSSTVGGNQTNYGTFPNALLKLLDQFKPDTLGGYVNAEVINLTDINNSLGL